MSVSVGDKVSCSAQYDYDHNTHLASFVWNGTNTYDVIQVKGDRVVIGKGSAVTAAVHASELTVIGGGSGSGSVATSVETPVASQSPTVVEKITYVESDAMTSAGIEDALTKLLYQGNENELLKYNMRLFGLPSQFTEYCDYRSYSLESSNRYKLIGRKFIENIMLEAPVLTIVPGKPLYLPAAKDKQGLTYGLMSAANGNIASLFAALGNDTNLHEKLRYYDFQQDYITYMKYVNILCATAAAYMDLQDVSIDGGQTTLTTYDWKNYRWKEDKYTLAVSNVLKASVKATSGFIDNLKTYGQNVINYIMNDGNGYQSTNTDSTTVKALEDNDDESMLSSLESVLSQMNFVQFYIDSSSGVSEDSSNNAESSKLEGIMDSGSELFKEVAFLANSGGVDSTALSSYIAEQTESLTNSLLGNSSGAISGVLKRILSAGSNVIQGDKMIFPKIYQSSSYNKSYSVTIDLRAPYGNKLSYYMNILVPLFHLIALSVPKQTTANTYGSPFLIKAFYPGVFSCNLGLVSSINIDKNASGDSWTVDGYPSEIKVTLNIIDLYSDLSITKAGDAVLFLANSSLIEYIATNCGVNLTTPQLINRVNNVITVVKQKFESAEQTITESVFSGLENLIASFTGV